MNEKTNVVAPEIISMYEHEEEVFRIERHSRRLFMALVVAIILLFFTNIGWLLYEGLYDTVSYSQDGAGINNINTGEQGDVLGDGAEIKDENSQE